MIITLATLAALWYIRYKVKGMWKTGQCRYVIGSIVIIIILTICILTFRVHFEPQKPKARIVHIATYEKTLSSDKIRPYGCRIPVLNPYEHVVNIVPTFPLENSTSCQNSQIFELLHVNQTSIVLLINPESMGWTDCHFGEMKLSKFGDRREKYFILSSKIFPITSNQTQMNLDSKYIGIQCQEMNPRVSPTLVLVDVLIQKKPTLLVRNKTNAGNNSKNRHKMINGQLKLHESVSHMTFLRSFNQSYEYIMQNLSAVELDGLLNDFY